MDDFDQARPSLRARFGHTLHAVRLWGVALVGALGVVLALSLPLSARSGSLIVRAGDVSAQDVLAPYALSYTSEVLTEEARRSAGEQIESIYDPPDSRVARRQLGELKTLLAYIDAVRGDPYSTQDEKLSDLAAISAVRIDSPSAALLLALSSARWEAVKVEATTVLEQVMRSEIREDDVDEVRRSVPALVSVTLPEDQANLGGVLASAFVAPNAFFNQAATEEARQQARQRVSAVVKSYAAGETIVGRGEIVQPAHLEALSAYGLLRPPDAWRQAAVSTLLATILAMTIALYVYRVHPQLAISSRLAVLLAVSFIIVAIVLQMMIPGRTVLPYLFPAGALPMTVAVVFGPGMGVLTAFVTGALAGYLGARGLELALFLSLSGAVSALVIGKAERLLTFFWAGVAGSVAAVAVIVVFRFPDAATDAIGKASLVGAAAVNGLLSASLAFGLILLAGSLLGIVTNLQLIELSRPDHPLLLMILRNAPGTYQHSLQVANLAEQCARAIGGNGLLTRVGALYHDCGKALHPHYYIENQTPDHNVHEQLDPSTSAHIIVDHVREGVELARRYRLPRQVIAFVPEHHGTLELTYQYQQALEAAGGDEKQVNRKDFSYPGPRPRSKETAILMLADGAEAKARADNPRDDEQIEQLVSWVIQDRLNRGQFDRTDLTLKDLDTIRRTLTTSLKGMYHPRLRYPETPTPIVSPDAAALPPKDSSASAP
jgi:putative nucleotidyltransferase with HDIG domain